MITPLKTAAALLLIICLSACSNDQSKEEPYRLISYLDIKVDSIGRMPRNPYVLQYTKDDRRLLVAGIEHSRDTLNPLFDTLEALFNRFKPDVIINEGGELVKHYRNRNAAIEQDGELGLEKWLADNSGIRTINGDEPVKLEFGELSKAYSREEAFLYIATERFVIPYASGHYSGELEEEYRQEFIEKYMEKEGVILSAREKRFSYYDSLYRKFFKSDLSAINQQDFNPFSRTHHFCEVTRASKELRDRYLLREIEKQLGLNKKVMVIYGGWHILAVEPALQQIMDRLKR